MRGEPNRRPNAASSAAPRFWSRNTSTGCSANTRPIQAKVTSSSGLERSMPNASVPSSSPSGRSWGELVMGGPPMLSPERCDWGTGTIIGLRAVRGENRKRWVGVNGGPLCLRATSGRHRYTSRGAPAESEVVKDNAALLPETSENAARQHDEAQAKQRANGRASSQYNGCRSARPSQHSYP